jgi:lipopolysaccharide transport system ATP-binding protein
VTGPTTGQIKVKGRIGSLLEVGTGFHPELTGRENIFLNGAILGMTRAEVRAKFDAIVDFAGIERYIDTPVKRYSSGMYVRLAFAVAAFLEPEILIVDEVLAVGDAEFQKKAIGKMQDVSKGEGRTILFVSHNMGAIENLCTSGIIISSGTVSYEGTAIGAVQNYYENTFLSPNEELQKSRRVFINLGFENPEKIWWVGSSLNLSFEFDEIYKNHFIDIAFYDNSGHKVFSIEGAKQFLGKQLKLGSFKSIELTNTGIVNSLLTIDIGIKEHSLSGYIYLESSSYLIRTQEQSTIHSINGKYLPELTIHV